MKKEKSNWTDNPNFAIEARTAQLGQKLHTILPNFIGKFLDNPKIKKRKLVVIMKRRKNGDITMKVKEK